MSERGRKWLLVASAALNVLLVLLLARGPIRAQLHALRGAPPGDASVRAQRQDAARARFLQHPIQAESTIFLGDSLTAEAPWGEMFANLLNRGVSGATSADVLARLDEVSARRPGRLVLMIGINDLARGISPDTVLANIELALSRIQAASASTTVALISILPVRETTLSHVENAVIARLNTRLAALAERHGVRFVDAFPAFLDSAGQLRAELTRDGLHLEPRGYWVLRELLLPVLD